MMDNETFIAYCKLECCWQASGSEYRMYDKADAHHEDTGHSTDVIIEEEWFKL